MKIARILYILLALTLIGLLCYQGFVAKNLTAGDLVKGLFVLAAVIFGFLRTFRKQADSKKAAYFKAYEKYIGNAFDVEPKLEKQLYRAIDDLNRGRYARGIRRLEKMDGQCNRNPQRFTVQFFMALCYERQKNYPDAICAYRNALTLRQHSGAASNLGMCCTTIGDFDSAAQCYLLASRLDSRNPYPLNNLAQLYLRTGDYEAAIPYALQAVELDNNFRQALNALTIAYAMLEDSEKYEHYYRRSITCGSNGDKLKAFIHSLKNTQ